VTLILGAATVISRDTGFSTEEWAAAAGPGSMSTASVVPNSQLGHDWFVPGVPT
jgi:hypothetical protein